MKGRQVCWWTVKINKREREIFSCHCCWIIPPSILKFPSAMNKESSTRIPAEWADFQWPAQCLGCCMSSLALTSVLRQSHSDGGSPHPKWWRETHPSPWGQCCNIPAAPQTNGSSCHTHAARSCLQRSQAERSGNFKKIKKDKEEHSVVIVAALSLVPKFIIIDRQCPVQRIQKASTRVPAEWAPFR